MMMMLMMIVGVVVMSSTAGSIAAAQLQGLGFNTELRLLSVWSLCSCSPHGHMSFLQVLQFPRTSQAHAGRWTE